MSSSTNDFVAPTPIKFGVDSALDLAVEARTLGMKHIFFVTDKGLTQTGIPEQLVRRIRSTGLTVTLFDDVVADPTAESINSAAQRYRTSGADSLVAFGGGSPMDTAKAIGTLVIGGGDDIVEYVFGGPRTPSGIPPLICLPTTSGTGSEVTFISIVTTGGAKHIVRHPSIAPTLALVDPKLCLGMPPELTASTGLDAMAHALEALTSSMAIPQSNELALNTIGTIAKWLPRAVEEGSNIEARSEMSRAATDAGIAFLNGRVHLGHAVGHALGTHFKIPHGFACAMCLPAILDFLNEEIADSREQLLAQHNGRDTSVFLEDLMGRIRAPRLGQATGETRSAIPKFIEIVESTEQRLIGLSRRRPSQKDWERIFDASF